jgi:hypothetical protein
MEIEGKTNLKGLSYIVKNFFIHMDWEAESSVANRKVPSATFLLESSILFRRHKKDSILKLPSGSHRLVHQSLEANVFQPN